MKRRPIVAAQRLLVTLGRARGVAVIDTAEDEFVATIPDVGLRPWGVVLH